MTDRELLHTISALSVEFGGERYVRGGGGNTSCKNGSTLWVKPSGLALSDMTPDGFVALSRERLDRLYDAVFPADAAGREGAVKDFMAGTVVPGSKGRPSVEAPLHNSFPQRFVVHTHPALVNGLTCGGAGEEACARLFPGALWLDFVEPGYTLSMKVREAMRAYEKRNGVMPEMLFLGNHGLFIAHDEAAGVRRLHGEVMGKVAAEVEKAGFSGEPARGPAPDAAVAAGVADRVRAVLKDDATAVSPGGWFKIPEGAASPDHIVYCRSYMFEGEPVAAALETYHGKHGYWPRVVAAPEGVFGFGPTQKVADLALELAWDAALVARYACAFGGMHYLEKRFIDFIEAWEVESYRQKQSR